MITLDMLIDEFLIIRIVYGERREVMRYCTYSGPFHQFSTSMPPPHIQGSFALPVPKQKRTFCP
jgi:hypothetical protein